MKTAAPILLALALAGCAHGGKLEVARQGDVVPAAGRSFALVEGQVDGVVQARIAAALTKAGLEAAPAAQADYLVTVAYTDRPSRIGVYTPPAAGKGEPAWLAQGLKAPRAWIRKGATALTVRIEDRVTAKTVREVEVRGFYWRSAAKAPIRLADAASAGLLQP